MTQDINKIIEDKVEEFAAMEHTRWAKWQSYVHSKCTENPDGSLTIPYKSVVHWTRQIATPYSQLTEREKESDRNEVRPYIEYAQRLSQETRKQVVGEIRKWAEDNERGWIGHVDSEDLLEYLQALENKE